jgi:RNA polymerase sigma factor (sigma-70 family)
VDASGNQANALGDAELVQRILRGEHQLYEVIIRRYNQRLYRVARSVVQKERNRHEPIDLLLSRTLELSRTVETPEHERMAGETRIILENAIDQLPEAYRSVFVMRALEETSIAETAQCLDISDETVKIRILRARRMLRRTLHEKFHVASIEAFQFLSERCDRTTANILRRITCSQGPSDKRTGACGTALPN